MKGIKLFLFVVLGLFFTSLADACEMKGVIDELAKYHGPSWNTFQGSSGCTNQQIKDHLKPIITDHETNLADYDYGLRALLYRNAVKSYGSFVAVDKQTGGVSQEDKNFLESFYKNPEQYLGTELYRGQAENFKVKILEAYKNTGSLDALEFFSEILSSDDEAPFLGKYAYEFGEELIAGQLETERPYGDRIYEEDFYPNLKGKLIERVGDSRKAEDIVKDFKDALGKFVANESGDKIRSRVIASMDFEKKRGPSSEPELSKVTLHDHSDHDHGDHDENKKEKERKPQSVKEAPQKYPWYLVLGAILGVLFVLGYLLFRKN